MRKKLCFLAAMCLLIFLVGCGENSGEAKTQSTTGGIEASEPPVEESGIRATKSAKNLCGLSYEDVVAELRKDGFSEIEINEEADLTSSNAQEDGIVTEVSINGVLDFSENSEFPRDALVVVTYHTIIKAVVPVSSFDIQNLDPAMLTSSFVDAGFVNMKIEEVLDLDPDEIEVQYINELYVNGASEFDYGDILPYDTEISFVIHRPYEKYTVEIDIDFIANIFFNRYGIVVCLEDEELQSLAHGEDAEISFRVKEGTYTVVFISTDSSNLKEKLTMEITSDIEAEYELWCYRDRIELKQEYFDRKIELGENQAKVPTSASVYRYGHHYQDVADELEDAGFTNIKTVALYDIFWGWTAEGEVESVTIGGNSSFTRGQIFEADEEIVITYHMPEEDDPSRIAMPKSSSEYKGLDYRTVERAFKELGFTNISVYSSITEDTTYADGETYSVKADYSSFSKGDTFEKNDNIVIRYYIVEEPTYIAMPESDSAYIGMDFEDVETIFENMGFTDVTSHSITTEDTAHRTGEVFSVTAYFGEFEKGDKFEPEDCIMVFYYVVEEKIYITMSDDSDAYIGMNCQEVEKLFKALGFSDIEIEKKETGDTSRADGEVFAVTVDGQGFKKGDSFREKATVCIKYYTPEEPVSYSTNGPSTVKNGNTGVYAYKKSGKLYDLYCVIDFDEGYVYWFAHRDENEWCDRVKIESGDLNSVVIITYHDGGDMWSWGLHFKWVNQPDHLILQDHNGLEYDYYPTDLSSALSKRNSKTVKDY